MGGYSHFSKWNAKRQQSCIRACGLALRSYRNKPARNEIISKLLQYDLPLDTEEVKRQLTTRNIAITTHHTTKLALMLLDAMSGTVRRATTNNTRVLAKLSEEKLAETARKEVERLMFAPADSGVSEAVLKIWKDRQKVSLVRLVYLHVHVSNSVCVLRARAGHPFHIVWGPTRVCRPF